MINRWLIQFGLWIARLGGYTQPSIPADLLAYAQIIVAEQAARWPERDGEAKRAVVYRQLVNVYPQYSKRLLSRVIEEAVCLAC